MKDLREDWELVALRLSAAPFVCVLSDFDGTLVPLEDRAEQIQLSEPVRRLIASLAQTGRAVAGIFSGRALDDVVARVGIDGIWYVGNHGFEIRAPDGTVTRDYEDEDLLLVSRVRDELAGETSAIRGTLVEYKGPIVALHYRSVDPSNRDEVERAFTRVMERHRARMMIARGHGVLEARLRGGRNKGTAVRLIRKQLPTGSLIAYFGDDITDRDAFRELRTGGIAVEVGRSDSPLAPYTLPDPDSVVEVLGRMLESLAPEVRKPGRSKKS